MNNLEYIDDYFTGSPGEQQKQEFAQRIIDDISFAEEVAFYISANKASADISTQDKKTRFRDIYENRQIVSLPKRPVKLIWRYAVAACITSIVLLAILFFSETKSSPQKLADAYIQQNLITLGVAMGSGDSLQAGLNFYNKGLLDSALLKFENILQNDSANNSAKKYVGIVSLRMKNYDKALDYFTALESNKAMFSNPGKFYHAITLMMRNTPGDYDKAKKLLEDVTENRLEGFDKAAEWLAKMN